MAPNSDDSVLSQIEQLPTQRAHAIVAGLVVFVACFLWIPTIESRLNPLTGDEPFYVVTSMNIVRDHDFNELNNYANRDYDGFYPARGSTKEGWQSYPDPLPPHFTHTNLPGIYTKHGLGLSFLIASLGHSAVAH